MGGESLDATVKHVRAQWIVGRPGSALDPGFNDCCVDRSACLNMLGASNGKHGEREIDFDE